MSKPTITRNSAGFYHFTGWVAGNLVQYSIYKCHENGRWKITKTYGMGAHFYVAYMTKRQAIAAITGAVEA